MKKKEATEKTPAAPMDKFNGKGTFFQRQIKVVLQSFSVRPKTMLEVARETGVERANICRYVARLRRRGMIELVRRGICPISRYRAGFWRACEAKQPRAIGEIMRQLPAVCPRSGDISFLYLIQKGGDK